MKDPAHATRRAPSHALDTPLPQLERWGVVSPEGAFDDKFFEKRTEAEHRMFFLWKKGAFEAARREAGDIMEVKEADTIEKALKEGWKVNRMVISLKILPEG